MSGARAIALAASLMLGACGAAAGTGAPAGPTATALGQRAFTERFVAQLIRARAHLRAKVSADLEAEVTDAAGATHRVYLYEAFTRYQGNPRQLQSILAEYVAAFSTALAPGRGERLVMPMVAARSDVDALLAQAARVPGAQAPNLIWEPFHGDTVVLYVLDYGKRIQFMDDVELQAVGLLRPHLARVSMRNLRGHLPEIQIVHTGSVLRVVADGTYESTLMLLDELWTKTNFPVRGDIVAFPVARDLLIVTGSHDADGLRTARELAARPGWNRRVSHAGFVRRADRWAPLAAPGSSTAR